MGTGRIRNPIGRWPMIVVLAAVAMLAAACGSDGAGDPDTRVVTVAGTGDVQGAPDTLRADLGVEAEGSDVSSAIGAVNAAARRVSNALRAAGVDGADIQTQEMSISPRYTGPREGEVSRVGGYQAVNTVRVVVRDLPKASSVLDAAIEAGGDQTRLGGISFAIEDDSTLVSDARKRAFDDARARAEQYASLSGDELGDVVSIEENVSGQQTPFRKEQLECGRADGDRTRTADRASERVDQVAAQGLIGGFLVIRTGLARCPKN
ncbi:MAG: SIMPL domain-containing protein [Gordonia sp. (in: high G+C Gram-positive bacteria)]|uniref:SIMPL domain-containing protein n=1 Tax=Gordonia sp. (in: high G+C Gram-positive bacteria) TaxID=84139 RepID=UPI0039E38A7F